MRTLGLDPGSRLTGYGCVDVAAPGAAPTLVEAGVFRLSPDASLGSRLCELADDLSAAVSRLGPDQVCIESAFVHQSWPASSLVMAHARGVALLVAHRCCGHVAELSPATVKKALTGSGRASKQQVQSAVQSSLGFASLPAPSDVADALAIALAASHRAGAASASPSPSPSPSSR